MSTGKPAAKTFTAPPTFYKKFERKDGNQETTHYCPGCGHGHIHKYIAEALHDFGPVVVGVRVADDDLDIGVHGP